MKSFYVSSKNMVSENDDPNINYPTIMPKKIYYGTDSGFVVIKKAYFSIHNNAKTVYHKDKIGYIGTYYYNIVDIIYNTLEGYPAEIGGPGSDGGVWINSTGTGYKIIKTECEYLYLNSNASVFFNMSKLQKNQNIESLGFNYVTNLYTFASDPSPEGSFCILGNISKLNFSNVINAAFTFRNCRYITGSPPPMPNATNMYCTYDYCPNISGKPQCGNNVVDLYGAYYNCFNLSGPPVCGPNVTNMAEAYTNCYKMIGEPNCNPLVKNLWRAYAYCANCNYASNFHFYGNDASEAFRNVKAWGNFYFHNTSINLNNCFGNRMTSASATGFNRLNIYIRTSIDPTLLPLSYYMFYPVTSISWTGLPGGQQGVYNLQYNIYVYNTLTS